MDFLWILEKTLIFHFYTYRMTWNDKKKYEITNTNDFDHQKRCIYCQICSNSSGSFGYVVTSKQCPLIGEGFRDDENICNLDPLNGEGFRNDENIFNLVPLSGE